MTVLVATGRTIQAPRFFTEWRQHDHRQGGEVFLTFSVSDRYMRVMKGEYHDPQELLRAAVLQYVSEHDLSLCTGRYVPTHTTIERNPRIGGGGLDFRIEGLCQ